MGHKRYLLNLKQLSSGKITQTKLFEQFYDENE